MSLRIISYMGLAKKNHGVGWGCDCEITKVTKEHGLSILVVN